MMMMTMMKMMTRQMKMMMMQMKKTVSEMRKESPAMLVIWSGSSGRSSPRTNVMSGVKETILM